MIDNYKKKKSENKITLVDEDGLVHVKFKKFSEEDGKPETASAGTTNTKHLDALIADHENGLAELNKLVKDKGDLITDLKELRTDVKAIEDARQPEEESEKGIDKKEK